MKSVIHIIKTAAILGALVILASADTAQAVASRNGYVFEMSTRVADKTIEGSDICVNNKNTEDVHSRSVTRTKTFTGSLSGEAEVTAFMQKVAVTAEVSYGSSVSETVTHNWTIPARSNYVCQWGYAKVVSSGVMKAYVNDALISSVSRAGTLSTGGYYGGYVF